MIAARILSKFLLLVFILVAAAVPSAATGSQGPSSVYDVGSIIINTAKRELMFVKGTNDIVVYSIAVGKQGRKWSGATAISRKVRNPVWAPPPIIRKANPKLPTLVKAGPNNPLGVAVLVLGDGTYGIHGTNRDETIGTDASFGCFRMHNKDILVLFNEVRIGTAVYVQQ